MENMLFHLGLMAALQGFNTLQAGAQNVMKTHKWSKMTRLFTAKAAFLDVQDIQLPRQQVQPEWHFHYKLVWKAHAAYLCCAATIHSHEQKLTKFKPNVYIDFNFTYIHKKAKGKQANK